MPLGFLYAVMTNRQNAVLDAQDTAVSEHRVTSDVWCSCLLEKHTAGCWAAQDMPQRQFEQSRHSHDFTVADLQNRRAAA
jgi:hypothetical protein